MDEPITYECTKCGKRFIGSAKGKGHTVPIYCCGENILKNKGKKKTSNNSPVKTKKK